MLEQGVDMFQRTRFISFIILVLFLLTAITVHTEPSAAEAHSLKATPKIYWTDREEGTIKRANLDGAWSKRCCPSHPMKTRAA